MSHSNTPADGVRRAQRSSSDWQTYRRLLRYLKGTGPVIFALIVCMILEAAFTAASIGLVNPLIQIAGGTEFVSTQPKAKEPGAEEKAEKPSMAPQFYVDLRNEIKHTVEPKIADYQQRANADPQFKFQILLTIIGVMLLFGFLMCLAAFGSGYLSTYLSTKAVQRLRNHAFSHLVSLDMAYFTRRSTGSMISLVTQDVQAVSSSLDVLFSSVIKNWIKMLSFIIMMVLISPSLSLITFLIVPLIGGAIYVLGRRIRKVSRRIQRVKAILSTILEEAFTGMRVIKGYNMERIETRRFEKRTREVFRMGLKTTAAEEIGSSLTQFLGLFTVAIVVLVGAYFVVIKQALSAGNFVVFALLLTQVFRPLKGASKVTSKIQKGLAGCDRVFAVLDTQATIVDRPGAVEAKPLTKGLRFDNVTFKYATNKAPALSEISLEIPAGSAVALVGETGSGKSTLANLIPRFYDPTSGAVMYDETDLRELQVKSLRNQLAIVTQDVVLFDDTVANNIAYGIQREVAQEEIERAAIAAKAHDFIMRMPEGYETPIGSRGGRMSGGERQRIAIARAILKDAPILILDEATSALDSETEAVIQEALSNLIRGRTTIIIAHRLSTIQHCDQIYVLDQGRIIEQGSHSELLGKQGRYARFHQIQFAQPA